MKIIRIKVKEAKPAAILSHVPTEREIIAKLRESKEPKEKAEAEERQESWSAWVADVKARGVIEPVKFIRSKSGIEIIDGRNRHAAAEESGMDELPGVEVGSSEVSGLVLATLAHRKGVTKGGMAYLALTMHPYLANRGKGRKEKRSECAFNSLSELALALGVGERTMDEAAQTFRYLEAHPAAKAEMEYKVISGIVDLGPARAGAGGGDSTKGKERRESSFASATRTIRSLSSQLRKFEKWHKKDQEAAVTSFAGIFKSMPAPARAALADALLVASEEGGQP